ncbi:FRG domain-containing protein [Mycobacterium colombiense]|uniref:FRG domain-containing protein n=1 Tax=Mycobacterium colombiense TaxID=339268 RepID=UPI0009BE358E|nr:FRG domain-containing protein [Mycobacterium colombiense]
MELEPSPELDHTEVVVDITEAGNIVTIKDLLDYLKPIFPQVRWFRGHGNSTWRLRPSLARYENGIAKENVLISEFKRDANRLLVQAELDKSNMSSWDWMFLMQHYGVPTRLIDWSESPLVALWFALADESPETADADAALWVLDPLKLNEIARITVSSPDEIPLCGHDRVTEDYLPEQINEFSTRDLTPIAVTASRDFDRIRAQYGTFTVFHKVLSPLEEIARDAVSMLVIPKSARESLRAELGILGIKQEFLFPSLDNLASRVKSRLK